MLSVEATFYLVRLNWHNVTILWNNIPCSVVVCRRDCPYFSAFCTVSKHKVFRPVLLVLLVLPLHPPKPTKVLRLVIGVVYLDMVEELLMPIWCCKKRVLITWCSNKMVHLAFIFTLQFLDQKLPQKCIDRDSPVTCSPHSSPHAQLYFSVHKICCSYSSIAFHFAVACRDDKSCCGRRLPAVITNMWTELEHGCYICWSINGVLSEHRILPR